MMLFESLSFTLSGVLGLGFVTVVCGVLFGQAGWNRPQYLD